MERELSILNIKQKLPPLLEKYNVVLAYVFGSAVRGQMGPHSDIDIGVVFADDLTPKEDFDRRVNLTQDIADFFNVPEADVVNLKTASDPLIKHNIIFTGVPVLVRDPNFRFAVEQEIVREYETTKPLRRIASRVLRQQLQDGTFGRPLIHT